jgi:hypothetical protein
MTNGQRPKIDPLVLAQFIETVPSRVRKRLEKEPSIAADWSWQLLDTGWAIQCGEETVLIQDTDIMVDASNQVGCSCLLSPRCFHVLACLMLLTPAAQPDDASRHETISSENGSTPSIELQVEIDAAMRQAAEVVTKEIAQLLRMGVRRADLLRQSGLLRAAHQCRAVNLVRLGNIVLGIVEGIRRLRDKSSVADSVALTENLGTALHLSEQIKRTNRLSLDAIGQSRRQFYPCSLRKLHGLCAEPILTLSGYGGLIVYLQRDDAQGNSNDDDVVVIHQARPGGESWIGQAYRGGIDLGVGTFTGVELSRGSMLVQNATLSCDGRLGKGRDTRWSKLEQNNPRPFSRGRFANPMAQQLAKVFEVATVENQERRAGWDLVAFEAQVLGAQGCALLVRIDQSLIPWKLRIAIDHPALMYRENLGMLARTPGLPIRCLGRVRLHAAGEIDLLAIAVGASKLWCRIDKHATPEEVNGKTTPLNIDSDSSPARLFPQLILPDSWHGICNLGCDRLERQYLAGIQRWSEEIPLAADGSTPHLTFDGSLYDGLEILRRRQLAFALGGQHAIAHIAHEVHRREIRQLGGRHQSAASRLLELMVAAGSQRDIQYQSHGTATGFVARPLEQIFLANHLYLRSASLHTQAAIWQSLVTT